MPTRTVVLVLLLPLLAGCAPLLLEGASRPRPAQAQVPPEYRPPPGKCRIWYPNRAPSRQPPAGDCDALRQRVPAGAALIRG